MPDQQQQPLTREKLLAIIEKAARENITTDKCETNGRVLGFVRFFRVCPL